MASIHKVYSRLHEHEAKAVDEAYTAAAAALEFRGLTVANDDRAERLVEAIAVFVTESDREVPLSPYGVRS